MTFGDMNALINELKPYVSRDENADEKGIYTISSIYMDNDALDCYYETINKNYFRQKVRLRVYGENNTDESQAFLEIKGKINGLVVKRRVKMILRDAMAFVDDCVKNGLDFDIKKYKSTSEQILTEIRYLIVSKKLKNKCVVSYDRYAFYSTEDPDLRITFDFNIRTRGDELDLTKGTYGTDRIPDGIAVLEVKTSKEIPFWLVKILADYGYRNQTFSKYCSHYSPQKLMMGRKIEK